MSNQRNQLGWLNQRIGNDSKFFFARFDDWQDFMDSGNFAMQEMLAKYPSSFKGYFDEYNYSQIPREFVTNETQTIQDLNRGFYTTYMEEALLENVLLAFDEILSNIDMGGSLKKSKLIITDKPQGIFDFGLASLGLFSETEFYSEKLAEESPNEFPNEPKGIVPPIMVTKNQLGDYWYVSNISGKKYKCVRQEKGTQKAIEDGYSRNEVPLKYKSFRTKQKKSYLMFKKKGGKAKLVDLYVPMGGLSGMTPSGMLQRALPLFMASRFFESVGIRTRLNCARVWASYGSNLSNLQRVEGFSAITITIKDFGEDLDFTRLAIAVADERTYRYNMWKLAPAIIGKETGTIAQYGAGRTLYGGDEMDITTRKYKNWYYQQIEENDKQWTKLEKPLMVFGGVPSPQSSWRYSGNKNEQGYQDVVEEFYRILDVVDLYYNDAKKACQRIYDRYVVEQGRTLTQFKTYILKVLNQSYNVVSQGEYQDPQSEVDKLNDEFDTKVNQVNDFLISIQ